MINRELIQRGVEKVILTYEILEINAFDEMPMPQ